MKNRVKKLAELLVLWNRNEIEPSHVCYEIWKLFKKEALEQWNGITPPNWEQGKLSKEG